MEPLEQITGHYVSVGGTRTFFDEVGSGVPIVCVHTAGSDSREYRYLLPLLAERGLRAIAVDLPGHSRSYPVDWRPAQTIHEHAEFVARFGRAVCGQRFVVIGCSIGGDITLDLVAHHSDELLAAVAMEGAAWTPTFPDPLEMSRPSWAPGWQDVMERAAISSLARCVPPERVTELRWQHRGSQLAAAGDLSGWANHDVRGRLGAARCPVLLVVGSEDFWVPVELVEATARELPDGEIAVLEQVGHYPMFEAPERVATLAADFLRRKGILPAGEPHR
ncbi:MAG: alpha/beta hydrolase [Deltaproteobacteria bacterium]|nr:alpha/beta hydrolase [Deltaproteobacteria bacterium]